jgi:membrane-associated phospholipid phosphatase
LGARIAPVDRTLKEERGRWLALAGAAVLPVLWMSATALAGKLSLGDEAAVEFMLRYRWPVLEGFMLAVSWISSEYVTPVILLGLLAFLWSRNRPAAWRAVAVMASSTLWQIALKRLIGRPRPEPLLFPTWQGPGFPSGHILTALVIVYLLWRLAPTLKLPPFLTRLLGYGVIFWPPLVGISRMYLNVHFLSDVTAGYLLGVWHVALAFALLGTEWLRPAASSRNRPL